MKIPGERLVRQEPFFPGEKKTIMNECNKNISRKVGYFPSLLRQDVTCHVTLHVTLRRCITCHPELYGFVRDITLRPTTSHHGVLLVCRRIRRRIPDVGQYAGQDIQDTLVGDGGGELVGRRKARLLSTADTLQAIHRRAAGTIAKRAIAGCRRGFSVLFSRCLVPRTRRPFHVDLQLPENRNEVGIS